jgi:hypothetical protein
MFFSAFSCRKGADEVTIHCGTLLPYNAEVVPLRSPSSFRVSTHKKTWGSPTFTGGQKLIAASIT